MRRNIQNARFQPVSIEDAVAIRETDKALLVRVGADGDDQKEVWIPKSQILDDSEVFEMGGEGTLVVPRWIVEEKELEEYVE